MPPTGRESPSERRWIVQKRVLESGKTIIIPEEYAEDFRVIRTNDPNNIFRMFQNGSFGQLYIFGIDFTVEKIDMLRIRTMANLEAKCSDVYICLDEEIPSIWKPILSKFNLRTAAEGIELVQI